MRLQRHNIPRTTGELQSLRGAQISPGEAAAPTLAKFGAIGAGLGAASDVAQAIGQTYQRLDDANDKVDTAIQDAYLDDALKGTKADHEQRSLADPEWTREAYVKDVDASLKAREDAIKNIRNPVTRKQQEQLFNATRNIALVDAAAEAGELDAIRLRTAFNVEFKDAINDDKINVARNLLSAATEGDTPVLSPEESQKARFAIEESENRLMATEEAGKVETAFLIGGEQAGENAYEELVRNESLDPEVKKKALLEAQSHRANFLRSQKDEKDRENADVIRVKTINSEAAKVGQFTNSDNDLALSNREYGDPESSNALSAWASVYQNIQSFNRTQIGVMDVSEAVNTGRILEPNKANRLLLDGYIQDQVKATGIEVNSDDYFRLVANTAQTTGTLPQNEVLGMNGGYVSKEQAQLYFPLWQYLKDNDQLKPDLGLTPDANTMYTAMDSLLSYGTPPEVALETIWKARDLKPADKEALTFDYEKEEAYTKSFKTLVNSDFFEDADKYFTLGPETETKMAMRYADVRKAVYMATNGNIAAANDAADKAIKSGWGPSNFGNADPDNYTIQENPLGKDMSTFQDMIISELNNQKVPGYEGKPASQAGVTFNAYDGLEYKQTKVLDKENISFVEVPQLDENRRDGVRRYQVLHNGRPVINMDTGMVMDFPISEQEARNITRVSDVKKERADEVERIQDRITELEPEIAKEQKVKSPYVDLQALKAELAGLKRALPNAQKRRDETKYAVYPKWPESQSGDFTF